MEEAAFDFEGLVELPEILPVGKFLIQFFLVLARYLLVNSCVLLVFAIFRKAYLNVVYLSI